MLGKSSKPDATDAGSVIMARRDESSWLARIVSAASISDCWTKGVTVCVPPDVAFLLVTWLWVTSAVASQGGTLTMAPAATLPDRPFFTALTATSAVAGMTVRPESPALGTVTAEAVANAILPAVSICVPAGIWTELPVFTLVNVTVPVAAVSTTFCPVALNVPSV